MGYLPGAGDSVAEGLEEMGYTVTRLTGADLTPERLGGLDAVVIGVRAFNVRDDLAAQCRRSSPTSRRAATSWSQYNRPERPQDEQARPLRLAALSTAA